MSTVIKGLTNVQRGANSGKSAAAFTAGLVISGILVPYNWTYAIAVTDDDQTIVNGLIASLKAALLNADYNQRAHYVGPFEAFTDKSEATTYQTLGYGKKVKTQRMIPGKEYQIIEGGIQYWEALQTQSGKINTYKWLEITQDGILKGTDKLDPTTGLVTGVQGVELASLEFQDPKQPNKTTVEEHILSLTWLRPGESAENQYLIQTGLELDSIVANLGVQDVTITAAGPMVAKVVDCVISTSDGGINLCNTLPGLIVDASFKFTNKETSSTAVTLTSVSVVDGKARFTFAGSGAGWVPGDHVLIELVDVTTLSTAGFKYYESVPVCSVVMVA